ncbi:MAG: hypothetical protein WA021_05495 [Minisyncoccia bacterium]
MSRPEVRKKIAEYILQSAKPELIAYNAINDRIADEFSVQCRTAYHHLLSSRAKRTDFVFDNLICTDPAYVQFISHRGFHDIYNEVLKKCNASPQDYSEDSAQKAVTVANEMKKHFDLDTFLFTKFFMADNTIHARVLAAVQSQ